MKTQPLPATNSIAQAPLTSKNFFGFVPRKTNSMYFNLDLSECHSHNWLRNEKLRTISFPHFFTGEPNELLDFNEPINVASFQAMLPHLEGKNWTRTSELCFVGLDFSVGRSKQIRKMFLRITPTVNNSEKAERCFDVVAQDISHLFKADFYWLHGSSSALPPACFHSQFQNYYHRCIISDREKDVLQGIVLGLNTEQIADKLFISPVTVNNHKQKMLKRTGTGDLVALIQVCKLCKIID